LAMNIRKYSYTCSFGKGMYIRCFWGGRRLGFSQRWYTIDYVLNKNHT